MPSLLNSYVAANYRQQQVPFSRFGTRKVAWYKIGTLDVDSADGVLDMAAFNTVIDTIQTRMEIVMIGAPYIVNDSGWNKFMIAVFEDTANDGSNAELADTTQLANSKASTLQDALRAATGNGNVNVERFYLYGAPASGQTGANHGFSSSNTYQEYTYKAEFVNNSYTQG